MLSVVVVVLLACLTFVVVVFCRVEYGWVCLFCVCSLMFVRCCCCFVCFCFCCVERVLMCVMRVCSVCVPFLRLLVFVLLFFCCVECVLCRFVF